MTGSDHISKSINIFSPFQAKDADSGDNGVIAFSISEIVFIQDNGEEQKFPGVFKVAKTMEKDVSVGNIQ